MTGGKRPDGSSSMTVFGGIESVGVRIRERHAEQAGAIGRPDQEVRRSTGGPGTGRAFEPSASVTRKNALLLDASRFRTYARRVPSGDQATPFSSSGLFETLRRFLPSASTTCTSRRWPTPGARNASRRPSADHVGCAPPLSGSTSSEGRRLVPGSPDVRRDLVGVRSIDIDDPQRVGDPPQQGASDGRRSDGRPATRPDRSRTRPARRAAPRQGRRSRR